MIKVIYVPLDERACNYSFPQKLADMTDDIQLLVPPFSDLGNLKKPANMEAIWKWIFDLAPSCEYAILSVDTLVYGNIINSRIHNRSVDECANSLNNFKKLKSINPKLKIHAFNLVARVAAYNDSHEDPDYWEFHGRDIWKYTYLLDKISQNHANENEISELNNLKISIPQEFLDDFLQRRIVDRYVNLACVDLVNENIFDILTIPKDDTSEYGYSAIDQKKIAKKVRNLRLMNRVLIYPGADEVGCILFTRIFNLTHHYVPKIYVRYSSTLGPTIVPNYEDRPINESIKSQICSLGGILEDNTDHADCMLALNTPGKHMIESAAQESKDSTFSTYLNMHEFLKYISYYCETYKKSVGIAEVSVCNGCENEFMDYACLEKIYDKVQAVGGWNTSQNTIGVVLAQTVIASYYNRFLNNSDKYKLSEEFKLRSIICDWLYQSNVLPKFLKEFDTTIDPFKLGSYYYDTVEYFKKCLYDLIDQKFSGIYKKSKILITKLDFSWDGVFYIDLEIGLENLDFVF